MVWSVECVSSVFHRGRVILQPGRFGPDDASGLQEWVEFAVHADVWNLSGSGQPVIKSLKSEVVFVAGVPVDDGKWP